MVTTSDYWATSSVEKLRKLSQQIARPGVLPKMLAGTKMLLVCPLPSWKFSHPAGKQICPFFKMKNGPCEVFAWTSPQFPWLPRSL
jgi:hypothetical protein